MRNNKDRWLFFAHDTRRVISAGEVRYWKAILNKNLKLGLEFEFNLPEQVGTCKGDSNSCPCVTMETKDCWQECARGSDCSGRLGKPVFALCDNQTGTCEEEECAKCEHYKASCPGMFCPNFESACLYCEDFIINCKTCENKYDPKRNPDEIRKKITKEMCPSKCYGIVSKSGVHSITTDGSLAGKGGAEVITVGRRVDYWEFFKMSKNILDSAVSKGAYTNERTSIHMHLLASYYGNMFQGDEREGLDSGIPSQVSELEKPMPEIILANFHQLCRRYQNALTWMTTGLDDPKKITRWEKFRVSVLDISAILNKMSSVRDMVMSNSGGSAGGKYGWVNYVFTTFDKAGDVKRLHLELRSADCLLSPTAVAALSCLYHAMMIKAVEISRYGIVEIGDSEWMDQSKDIKKHLMNNNPDGFDNSRFSDTSGLEKYYNILIGESLDLVRQLKHILIKMGPAYDILDKLAERPCSLRRCSGDSWETIEKDLEVFVAPEDKIVIAITEYIDLRYVSECKDIDEWISAVGKGLSEDPDLDTNDDENIKDKIEEFIGDKRDDGEVIWSESLGTVIMV